MLSLNTIIICVVVAICLAAVSPPARRFFRSIGRVGEAKLNSFAESIGAIDPLADFSNEIENSAEFCKKAQANVSRAAADIVSLERQVNSDLDEQTQLSNKIRVALKNGDPNQTAKGYAADLAKVEARLVENRAQLENATVTYKENLTLVTSFEEKIKDLRKKAEKFSFQLEQSESEKIIKETTNSLKQKLGNSNIDKAEERIQNRIDLNRGAAMASGDMGAGSAVEKARQADLELERDQQAEEILARFK